MLHWIDPASPAAIAALSVCFVLVLAFEVSNGFHDTANAVATVIYTHSLRPIAAVLLSGAMNFAGVLLGGVAVAFTLVELLPPDVLTPPDGNPAVAMLLALFLGALAWNVATWWRGLPASSSHALIGGLLGIGLAEGLRTATAPGQAVDWSEAWAVLRALLVSPAMGFVGAAALFRLLRRVTADGRLFQPTDPDRPPVLWVRLLLILTCSGVSFAHGSNDGQKSIGLIMLTVIGLMPGSFALNVATPPDDLPRIAAAAARAEPLLAATGTDAAIVADARRIHTALGHARAVADVPEGDRASVRDAAFHVIAALKEIGSRNALPAADRAEARRLHDILRGTVEYAPGWVRLLSALCLGGGTMIGYRRIVRTLGERIGRQHLTPAQGASAELVGAALIGSAGWSGLPVSTTHIVTSGVAGTMVQSGAGIRPGVVWQIAASWVLTLPATILLSGGLFWLLAGR
ncbi:MAG: anion permease [Rhodospirillales bacterium 69-11]|nr:inorganic phosphate transporter [Rhodospirillales bacterium]OJW24337.1 MAG: anion permease [Rhodospirillales bacterium 69-11]